MFERRFVRKGVMVAIKIKEEGEEQTFLIKTIDKCYILKIKKIAIKGKLFLIAMGDLERIN